MLPPNPKWMVKNIRWSLFFHWLINKALKPWQPAPWFLARSQNALPDGCSAHQAGRIRACPLSLYCHLGIKQSEWSAGGLLGYKTSPISLHCCLSFSLPLHNTKIKNHKKNSKNNKKSKKNTICSAFNWFSGTQLYLTETQAWEGPDFPSRHTSSCWPDSGPSTTGVIPGPW